MHLRRGQSLSIASLERSFPTTSIFGIERLDDSPNQGTNAPLHFGYATFHLLDAIAIPFSLLKAWQFLERWGLASPC